MLASGSERMMEYWNDGSQNWNIGMMGRGGAREFFSVLMPAVPPIETE